MSTSASQSISAKPAGTEQTATAPKAPRLMSLDVFRGVTIASMMLVNNAGDWDHIYTPLEHAKWHGWTFTDTIFPFFLWIVGVAIPLSLGRRVEQGENRTKLFVKMLQRAAILFAIGLFLNAFTFFWNAFLSPGHEGVAHWMQQMIDHLRYPGVLQRIAVCYLFAGLIFLNTTVRGQIRWTIAFLSIYWVLMKCVPVPGFGAGVLDLHGNFSEFVDTMVFNGHVFRDSTTYDPEGVISTLPAIATTLFGILIGQLLRRDKLNAAEKTNWMFVIGALLMFAAQIMTFWMPINKRIWTSSYSVWMAGLATTVFAIYYWLIDVKGYKTWAKPFAIYGMNAIAVFILAGLIGRLTIEIRPDGKTPLKPIFYEHTFGALGPNGLHLVSFETASMLWGLIVYSFGLYLVAWLMCRKKWFLKF